MFSVSTGQLGIRAARTSQSARVLATLQSDLLQHARGPMTVGKIRVGRQVHRLTWRDGRDLRFIFDLDAGAVTISGLINTTAARMDQRGVRQLLRPYLTPSPEREVLDPRKGELRAFVQHGSLSLSITVFDDAFEYCTSTLLRIADRVIESQAQ
ncbi:hypothetical protein [Steroidobacter cummioxidans]|uniref:hypothetical protein n=1 Tax=Steroidobacter cummioxidans TaxID=1803913 RepID=UPI000E30B44B|nr:hypothetical protein [Steroidobacter cummioxidans]